MTAVPSAALDAKLLKWLDHDPGRFERYITAHPEIADRIDELTSLRAATESVRSALMHALEVPVGLAERMAAKLSVPDASTDPASVIVDLLGLGAATMQVLLDPE